MDGVLHFKVNNDAISTDYIVWPLLTRPISPIKEIELFCTCLMAETYDMDNPALYQKANVE